VDAELDNMFAFVDASADPVKYTDGREPATLLVEYVGCVALVEFDMWRAFPLLSFHCETFVPVVIDDGVILALSEASNHN
jgi:hypothetical protein